MSLPTTTTMRDSGYAISPQWMRAYWFSRIMYALWVQYDALLDAGGYAVLAGLPSKAPLDALPWIGKDRQIFQGPNEPTQAYIARLQQWLDLWRHAGSSTGILLALRSYVAPLLPKILTVQSSGDSRLSSWDTYDDGESPFPPGASNPTPPDHYVYPGLANWDWDGAIQPFYFPWMYWRKWVVIFSPPGDPNSPWTAPTATWSPATGTVTTSVVADPVYGTVYQGSGGSGSVSTEFDWDDGTNWDWTGSAADATSLTSLAKQWKSAGCWIPWIIVTYDATMFDETSPVGINKPDGTWGYWGKVVTDATFGTVYTASRPASSTCSLLAGTADGGGPGVVLGVG